MHITPDTRVADLATAEPATIRIFQRHTIDFCCGGKRPLRDVCREQDIPFDRLAAELETAVSAKTADRSAWHGRPLSELTAHIVETFHEPLRAELPRLIAMARKVEDRHGRGSEPNAGTIAQTLEHFAADLDAHMLQEEAVVFPLIDRLGAGTATALAARDFLAAARELEDEHAAAGAALATLRRLSNDHTPAAGVCPTTLGLYHGLGELEALMHLHVHLENNVLFPRAAAQAQGLTEARVS